MKKGLILIFALMISIAFVSTGFTQDKPKAAPEKKVIKEGADVKAAEPTEAAVGATKKKVPKKEAREIEKTQKSGKEGADVKAAEPAEAAVGAAKKSVPKKQAREIEKTQKSGKAGADVKAADPTEAATAAPKSAK